MALAVPNFGSLQARLFGRHWFHLDLPRHTHHFRADTLRRCLERCGFDVETTITRSAEQDTYGFVQSLLNKLLPSARPNDLYDLLRNQWPPGVWLPRIGWLTAAAALTPLAVLEYSISWSVSTGATLIVYARRR